jgi:hypothetical protein
MTEASHRRLLVLVLVLVLLRLLVLVRVEIRLCAIPERCIRRQRIARRPGRRSRSSFALLKPTFRTPALTCFDPSDNK